MPSALWRARRQTWPLSQTDIGDALGLTPIYVNQIIKQLRLSALMAVSRRRIEVMNWAGLQAAGDFDPAYLHAASRSARFRLAHRVRIARPHATDSRVVAGLGADPAQGR